MVLLPVSTINKEWAEMLEKENFLKWELFCEDS